MSDHDAMPDPVDHAYAAAQALLNDEATRGARRAAVLDAVARDRAVATAAPARVPVVRRHAGWLTAASVAALGAFFALELAPFNPVRQTPPLAPGVTETPPVAPAAPAMRTAPPVVDTPAVDAATSSPAPAAAAPPVTAPAARSESAARFAPPAAALPPPPPIPTVADARAQAGAITHRAAPLGAQAPGEAEIQALADTSSAALGARLRAAAAAGRTAELKDVLAAGTLIDAADAAGDTALMKAVQAGQPAAAAFLRASGANIDRKNRAGDSARDMARSLGNPEINRALGLER